MADNEAKLVIKAEDQTAGAFRSVETRLSSLDGVTAKFGGALAGLGALGIGLGTATAALAIFQQKIGGAISEMSSLDDAAEKTGASVESLSSIFNTLKPGGTTLNEIVDLGSKLVKAMKGADEETSQAAEAFQKLGIATRDASGNFRSTDAVMIDLANALARYTDDANKTAIAQAILGKTGAEYLPKLKDLATESRAAATVTAEMAAASEKLEKEWGKLKVQGEGLGKSIAAAIIPGLTELIQRFREAGDAGVGFFDRMTLALMRNSSISEEISKQQAEIDRLKKQLDSGQLSGGLLGGFLTERAESDIKKREAVLDSLRKMYDRFAISANIAGAADDMALSRAYKAPLDSTPKVSGKPGKAAEAERKPGTFEDYQMRIAADVGKLLEDAPITKAKELADKLRVLDDLALKSGLDFDLYAQAVDKLFKGQTDGSQKARDELQKLGEKWKDVADPAREYYRQLDEIVKLEAQGYLEGSEALKAREKVIADMNKALGETSDKMKEVDDIGKQLGMTFQSAAEDAILEFKSLRDVLQGILKDIARIALREGVTKPFAGMVAGFVNSFMGAQTTTPNANVGYEGYDPVLLGKSVSGPSVTVVNNIDSTTDRAVVAQLVNQATKSAVAQVYDRQSRNDWKAVPA